MGEAKPTPGPWWLDEYGNLRCGVPVYRDRVLITGISMPTGNSKDYEEAKANRDLLFDAGTVFHTTGLTPSQLVERVKELEEALNKLAKSYERVMQLGAPPPDALKAARAALSKDRPNTADGEASGQAVAGAAPSIDIKEAAQAIAVEVAKNCGSVPQLTFPHIYLGLKDLLTANLTQQAEPAAGAVAGMPPGISALMCVISSLRDTAHFSDEEGELTDELRTLRDWAMTQAAAPTPSAAKEPSP